MATTKYQKYALLMLENSQLIAYFDCVAGSMEDKIVPGKRTVKGSDGANGIFGSAMHYDW